MSEDFGFDPTELFRRRPPTGRGRPRLIRPGGRWPRWQRIVLAVIAVIVVVVLVLYSLLGLRVRLLFLDNLGHTNVFWTPVVTGLVLFLIGFIATAGLLCINLPLWRAVARNLDERGPTIALIAGLGLAGVAGIIAGAVMAGQWQQVQLFLHGHDFGQSDPVFHQDYSFFIFRLPVYDLLQGVGWGVAIVSLLSAIGLGVLCAVVEYSPEELPVPFRPPIGGTPRNGLRIAALHAGGAVAAIFVLAALGAHFGVYHLATSQHTNFVGLDATQRDVTRPVLGFLQYLALALAVVTVVLVLRRRGSDPLPTAITFGSLLLGWLVVAGLLQGVPAAIYSATKVNPNASTLQLPPIADFLNTSRYAWSLQVGTDVENRNFGTASPPTVADLAADPQTISRLRLQDITQLPEVFRQIDSTKPYQTYPAVTVDRYTGPDGSEQLVMFAPREISENNIPSQVFVSKNLQYTHGYGITAASPNLVGAEGKPVLLAGNQPEQRLTPAAPADLGVTDPRIYCGLETTQPAVVNTSQAEFDYIGPDGEKSNSYGNLPGGIKTPGAFDRLALSLNQFNGFDLFLTSNLNDNSRIFLHRDITDRIQQLAPFLRVDGDPYLVADPQTGHLDYIADAYVATDLFPESFRLDDGTSYMRNAVKAVVDARTCDTTLYAVDLNEPLTASYNEIFPNLLRPIDQMPAVLQAHLRYPEDLFAAQSQVYSAAHITNPIDLFNQGDLFRVTQETINGVAVDTRPYYVEETLPGDNHASFALQETFSPARGAGGGVDINVLTGLLIARSDYSAKNHFHPTLEAVRINTQDNVLGPFQFDNNVNTDGFISGQITLLSQRGSTVYLGSVVVVPFNNHSFLYLRPLYVTANGSFPQLRFVVAGTQNKVGHGATIAEALADVFGQSVPGAPAGPPGAPTPTPSPSPSPGASPSPSPLPGASATPAPGGLSPQVTALLMDLFAHEANFEAANKSGDFTTAGKEQDAIQKDLAQLRILLGPSVSPTPTPSPATSPSP